MLYIRNNYFNHIITQRQFTFPRFLIWRKNCFPPRTRLSMSVQIEKIQPISTEVSPPKKKIKMPTDDVVLKFAKMTQNAFSPTRGSKLAAGYDLYSAYDAKIPSKGKAVVKTDIQIALPAGCYGRVAPRSGLAAKHFIDVGAGVIDQDYRGNVGVVMFNFAENEFEVKKGDRIAQLICERIYIPELEELTNLDETDRGSGGFGSTGKN